MNPLVSILIPAYNAETWLSETIESAIGQTWKNKEVVIVDDGSKDGTVEVAKRYASSNVRVISQKNQGAAAARNTAFAAAEGDYIQWLDADDVLDPHKVENQVRKLGECTPRTLVSGAWGHFMYRKRKATFNPSPLWATLSPADWMSLKMLNNAAMQTDNWLVSRELSEAAGQWDTRMLSDDDGEYFNRVILAADRILFVPEAKSFYRRAGFGSLCVIGRSDRKIEAMYLSMTMNINYLFSLEKSDRTRLAAATYIRDWLPTFYPTRMDLADKLRAISAELGMPLEEPVLPWKYNWIVKGFGWDWGRRAQITAPRIKHSCIIAWDKVMMQLEAAIGH